MPNVTASYETPFDFIAFLGTFIHCRQFMFEPLDLHQTFTDCVSNQYTHTDVSTCQI